MQQQRRQIAQGLLRRDAAAQRPDWGVLGPAMKALNERQQNFVYLYVSAKPRRGALVEAYRQAGYGKGSTPSIQAKAAWQLSHDERVLAAITEESRKIIRTAFPTAANALVNLLLDSEHREHGRAIGMVMERAFPAETRHSVEVVHKTVDPDAEAIEELRALRKLGTPREKLIELFGGNGLDRVEALERADANRRAQEAKLIDGEMILPDGPAAATEPEPAYAEGREDDF